MNKKVVIVSSTMRKGGNSELLAEEFAKGAREVGNEIETIFLRNHSLEFCKGCMACLKAKKCVIKDDTTELMEKVRNADILVFATPIYYYAMCGQLKTFLDRMNPIYTAGHHFKKVYLLTTAADEDNTAMQGAIKEVEGWVSCFDRVKFVGSICGTNTNEIGDIKLHKEKLEEAYQMGKNIL